MRRFVIALLATGLVGLAGCSYGAEPAPTGPSPMAPEPPAANTARPAMPESWLGQVCASLTPVVATSDPVPEISATDPAASRTGLVAYLDRRIQAFSVAADAVNQAGPAPVEGGQSVTEPLVETLRDRGQTLTDLRSELEAVPANDPLTLQQTQEQVRANLALAGGPALVRDLALTPGLTSQAGNVPACQEIGVGATG